jgi:putative nucleotidyltransferase with HDIG domain
MSTRITLPPAVRPLLTAAHELLEGREGYLVGGSVRDALAERPLDDLDLAVSGDAFEFTRRLADHLGGHYVVLDAERSIARCALDGEAVRYIDVASLRGDIANDLSLRDFTINALAAPIETLAAGAEADVIDPHDGAGDIERGVVRLVAERSLDDDPLRMLRAVRHSAELAFALDPATADSIRGRADLIASAAPERQRDELLRPFATPRAAAAVRMMDSLGLLERILPEVAACRGVTQPKEHYWDVLDHSIEAVANFDFLFQAEPPEDTRAAALWRTFWVAIEPLPEVASYIRDDTERHPRSALLKLAALLHDVAKPETRAPDETGRIRFFGHCERGAEVARAILRRLRFSRHDTDFVATLVEEHLRPGQLSQEGLPTRRALYRFYRDTGEAATGILLLSLADDLAARGPRLSVEEWSGLVGYIAWVAAQPHEAPAIVKPPRLVTGSDLIEALGLAPGPEVGRLLAAIDEAIAAGEVTNRDEALALARRKHAASKQEPALCGSAS